MLNYGKYNKEATKNRVFLREPQIMRISIIRAFLPFLITENQNSRCFGMAKMLNIKMTRFCRFSIRTN